MGAEQVEPGIGKVPQADGPGSAGKSGVDKITEAEDRKKRLHQAGVDLVEVWNNKKRGGAKSTEQQRAEQRQRRFGGKGDGQTDTTEAPTYETLARKYEEYGPQIRIIEKLIGRAQEIEDSGETIDGKTFEEARQDVVSEAVDDRRYRMQKKVKVMTDPGNDYFARLVLAMTVIPDAQGAWEYTSPDDVGERVTGLNIALESIPASDYYKEYRDRRNRLREINNRGKHSAVEVASAGISREGVLRRPPQAVNGSN